MTSQEVSAWLAGQTEQNRAGIERLREVVRSVDAPWVETVKWNAPNFALDGEDRVTLGVERRGGWRVVLHRGAAAKADGFAFRDASGLEKWPSPDRGVVAIRDLADLDDKATALAELIGRWVRAAA
jgi:hypothetical protein